MLGAGRVERTKIKLKCFKGNATQMAMFNRERDRHGLVGFCQLLLGLRSSPENLAPLGKHVQVHLRKEGHIADGHNPDEVVKGEAKIEPIRQFHTPFARIADVALGPVAAQQLSQKATRIHRDEDRVPQPNEQRRYGWKQQVSHIVAVPNDFGQTPAEQR